MLLAGLPLTLARRIAQRADDMYARATCRTIGHDWSWPFGIATGHTGPICRRCHTPR